MSPYKPNSKKAREKRRKRELQKKLDRIALMTDRCILIGMGPLRTFDVVLARAHGWTEESIRRAWLEMTQIVKREGDRARRRNPHLYKQAEDGTWVFVGEIPMRPGD